MEWQAKDCDELSTRCELPLMQGFDDAANPATIDADGVSASPVVRLSTIAINGDGGTATDTIIRCFPFRLNDAYENGSDFTVEPVVHNSRSITVHAKVDVKVFKLGSNGVATGSDLCGTAEVTFSGVTTPTQYSFAVDGSGLVKGERCVAVVSVAANDTGAAGGSANARSYLDRVDMVGTSGGGLKWFE